MCRFWYSTYFIQKPLCNRPRHRQTFVLGHKARDMLIIFTFNSTCSVCLPVPVNWIIAFTLLYPYISIIVIAGLCFQLLNISLYFVVKMVKIIIIYPCAFVLVFCFCLHFVHALGWHKFFSHLHVPPTQYVTPGATSKGSTA